MKNLDLGRSKPVSGALACVLLSLQLLVLDLSKNVFGYYGKQLFGALGKLKYLKKLNLRCFRATETGVETLAEVLPSLQLLEKLVLEFNTDTYFDNSYYYKQLFGSPGKLNISRNVV